MIIEFPELAELAVNLYGRRVGRLTMTREKRASEIIDEIGMTIEDHRRDF